MCTGTKGCHVELSNKRDQAGNDQKEKPEASQDTSETTSHDQPIQTEGYMEGKRSNHSHTIAGTRLLMRQITSSANGSRLRIVFCYELITNHNLLPCQL